MHVLRQVERVRDDVRDLYVRGMRRRMEESRRMRDMTQKRKSHTIGFPSAVYNRVKTARDELRSKAGPHVTLGDTVDYALALMRRAPEHSGMSVHDWFAGQAMLGIVQGIDWDVGLDDEDVALDVTNFILAANVARRACVIADAMIAERQKHETKQAEHPPERTTNGQ